MEASLISHGFSLASLLLKMDSSIGELDVLGITCGKDSDDQVNKSSQKSNQRINELHTFKF